MMTPEPEYLQTGFPRSISATDKQKEDSSGGSHHVGGAAWSVFMYISLRVSLGSLWSCYCIHGFQLAVGGSKVLSTLLTAN